MSHSLNGNNRLLSARLRSATAFLILLSLMFGMLAIPRSWRSLLPSASAAGTVLSGWGFESVATTNTGQTPTVAPPGGGVADTGALTAGSAFTAFHTSTATTWSNPAGNGSSKSISSNNWGVGDYYQFSFSTTGYNTIIVTWDQTGSSTGPKNFKVQYSTNGSTFTDASGTNSTYALGGEGWSTSSTTATSRRTVDLSGVASLNNQSAVFIRFVDTATTSIGGGTVATGGTGRIDNFNVSGTLSGTSTNPTGVGAASPASAAPGQTSLLTVSVTPGTNPPSTAHTVSVDLSAIGGSATQQFFDNGTNGDVTAGDNVFSYSATVANGTSGGTKTLPFTVQEVSPSPLARTGSGNITLTILTPTNPTGTGTATPNSVLPGGSSTLAVNVTPGANPTSTLLAVSADLSSIGGPTSQPFSGNGNSFTFSATVDNATTPGIKSIPFTITDGEGRSGGGSITITVKAPPPPNNVVISQVYGGGGNTGADLKNDFIELVNHSSGPVNLNGWSVQYASAGQSNWQATTLPDFTLQPGQYFLIQELAGQGGTTDLPAADATGAIAMGAGSGKVALVNNAALLTSTCPDFGAAGIVDFVGYGNTAGCAEGSPAPTLDNTTAAERRFEGCSDTNDNSADFTADEPDPRNSSSLAHPCTDLFAYGTANPSSVAVGNNVSLKVVVSPAQNPSSTGITVTADLTAIGGSQNQILNGGSGGVFSFNATVPVNTPAGFKSLPVTISDGQARTFNTNIVLSVLPLIADHITISQIYGGGGNTDASYQNDYVELYNPTASPVTVTGWSIQYGAATGTTWTNKQPIGGTIGSGEYMLVALGSGGATGATLPPSQISGGINLSGTAGKVALVKNSDNLTGPCPLGTDPDVVDFVGYGSTANCHEGTANAPAPSNTTAIIRKNAGSQDTDQNVNDFVTGAPNPRQTAPIAELGPWVAGTDPSTNGNTVPHDATVTVDFSEPVNVDAGWFNILCTASGSHNDATVASTNSAKTYAITPNVNFQFGEQCTVTIPKTTIHDQDTDDSQPDTDTLFADYTWSFSVVSAGQPAPYAPSVHLTMGDPSCGSSAGCATTDTGNPDNYLMQKPTYSLSYNRDKGTPNWVSWHLDNTWYGTLARVDTFRADPAVPSDWYRVEGFDYSGSGFDRGHMTPNADRDNQNRVPINQETYLMSNMVPQAPDNNQGPWAALEGDLRTLADQGNELYIVSGPLGVGGTGSNGGTTNTLANGHVTVPAYTWKVALVIPKAEGDDVSRVSCSSKTIAVLMPNVQGIRSNPWQTYLTTVDNIEQMTGYDFFSNVSPTVQACIEAGTNGVNRPGTADQTITGTEDNPITFALNALNPISGGLTATTSQPAHGGVVCTDINCTYTPQANFNGTDSFTFRVNNGQKTSNTSTVTVNVAAVNDAPTANGQTPSTLEDSATTITLTGSDIETPAANLTFNITQSPSNGTLSGTAPNLTYKPAPNFNGSDSFKFTVTDGGDGSSPPLTSAEATVTINVVSVNDLPVAANDQSGSYPSVQYSDAIQPVNFTASDIETPADQLVPTETFAKDCGPTQSGLPSGLSLAQTANTGKWTLAGNITAPAGTYNITVTFTDADGGAVSSSASIVVTKEDATVAVSGPTAVAVDPSTGKSSSFTLNATLTEFADGSLGSIANAAPVTFQLTPVGSSLASYSCTAPAITPGTSTASCTFNNINVDVYDITAVIGSSYYQGSGRSVIAVYDPSLGFVTGSGRVTRTVNGETFVADFSVNLKYQKNGPALGSFSYVEHHSSGDVSFVSNSMGALALVGTDAKVIGNGSLNGIENYSFVARFVDVGEPGTNDQLALRLTDSGGNVINDVTFDPVKLSSGNIRVH